jgi:hypothetical protein
MSAIVAAVLGGGLHHTVDLLDLIEYRLRDRVDVVRAGDDLLPRLAYRRVLGPALVRAARVLRPRGLLLAAVLVLDRLRGLRPVGPPPRVTGRGADRRVVTVQLWGWAPDGCSYGLKRLTLAESGYPLPVSVAVATG